MGYDESRFVACKIRLAWQPGEGANVLQMMFLLFLAMIRVLKVLRTNKGPCTTLTGMCVPPCIF
eukprot:1155474-Pelagomonas_calceolata.AAC.8